MILEERRYIFKKFWKVYHCATCTTTYHCQVDQRYGIEVHTPQVHNSEGVHNDHDDVDENEERRNDIKAEGKETDDKDGDHRYADVDDGLIHKIDVLLIVDIKEAATEEQNIACT